MTPYERLLAEQIPTGTFGDAPPHTSRPQPHTRPWTAQEQLDHRRALEVALEGWTNDTAPRHLRAIRNEHAA
ncbi:hypothetical protein [Streptomyces sp. NBC_00829]|uniref:hypothetical protein n=1 Tax=Streptomyces sp. NBC_00829 TaxID=2903679 RepID=UPI00386FBC5B|nr:hypothetical protein OG293_23285 [Streptomyces sp. NBC_00829]